MIITYIPSIYADFTNLGFREEVEPLNLSTQGICIAQIEIYDRVWYIRHMPESGDHSVEGIELVKEFISRLEQIPDGCAERFPFEQIEGKRQTICSLLRDAAFSAALFPAFIRQFS